MQNLDDPTVNELRMSFPTIAQVWPRIENELDIVHLRKNNELWIEYRLLESRLQQP